MSESPTDAWFYTANGERLGPVAKDQLRELATTGALHPRQDLCWTNGMDEWQPAGEIHGLFEKKQSEEGRGAESSDAPNPHHRRNSSKLSESDLELELLDAKWPGASRRVYLFTIWVLPVLVGLVLGLLGYLVFNPEDPGDAQVIMIGYGVTSLVLFVFMVFISLLRFQNLGMSRFWFLGNFIPLLNLWVGYRSVCCPAGYEFHRKMDGIGIFLAILYWGGIVLFMIMIMLAVGTTLGLFSGGMFEGTEEMLEGWLQQLEEMKDSETPQEE